jgi:hypothetical protein
MQDLTPAGPLNAADSDFIRELCAVAETVAPAKRYLFFRVLNVVAETIVESAAIDAETAGVTD